MGAATVLAAGWDRRNIPWRDNIARPLFRDAMTRIPDPGFRVESGPLKFGSDWAGLFVRGDNAASYADALRMLLDGGGGAIARAVCERLMTQLQGTRENG